MPDDTITYQIIKRAKEVGFSDCGVASAEYLSDDSRKVEQWLAEGCEGAMSYLDRNKDKRYDPRLLVEGTKSIVTVICNYFPEKMLPAEDNFKIAKYAYGTDYHQVMKDRLQLLLDYIETACGPMEGARMFVDSAPVLDRAWAVRCGLGFIGKNTMLIHPKKGSFFFVGHLFLPIAIESRNEVITNRCGRCTRCLDACPTGALKAPFVIDARKCISYLTIEYKGGLEAEDKSAFHDWIYGCDICQDVCPYNRFSVAQTDPAFHPSPELMSMRKADWRRLDEEKFKMLFEKSAVQRAGFAGLKRNIDFLDA